MAVKVNLNADIAEGWGAYDIGNDAAMMEIVKSANVACGMHAGDANTMHRLVMMARERGVSIGAHPGFNDLWGFGRRQIRMSASELEYLVAYQIGALQGMATYAGLKVTHLKPHGAMSNMACVEPDYAMAIARAIRTVDRGIIFVVLFGSEMEKAGAKLGLRLAREGFCDRVYADDGQLAPRSLPGTVLKDPAKATEQAVRFVRDGEVVSINGKLIKAHIDTLCVHGDEATGVAVARAVRKGLEAAGIEIVPLPEMALAN
jgi:5-oxoprolinase (ATP-hydrolysing) subunit A